MESLVANDPEKSAADPRRSAELHQEIRELLGHLPPDVVSELNDGKIDVHDGAFLAGLTDHVSRLSLADPQTGKMLLGKLVRIKKLVRRSLRDSHEDVETSSTIRRSDPRVGRNDHCPCGSGRKFKDCCLRNRAGG